MPWGDEAVGADPALVDRITRIAARVGDEDFKRSDPPPDLWARISAGTASASVLARAEPVAPLEPAGPAEVVVLDERRHHRSRRLSLAAAAIVVVVAVTGLLLARDDSSPDQQLVASASLEPLEETTASADVRLVREDGDLQLVLEAHDMAAVPAGHHYELWLLGEATNEPVSLGPMTGSVTVPVPAGLDVDEYDVVDVSLQRDGQIAHSNDSLLRGTLA
jgi:anti-sigma-K factor RskA